MASKDPTDAITRSLASSLIRNMRSGKLGLCKSLLHGMVGLKLLSRSRYRHGPGRRRRVRDDHLFLFYSLDEWLVWGCVYESLFRKVYYERKLPSNHNVQNTSSSFISSYQGIWNTFAVYLSVDRIHTLSKPAQPQAKNNTQEEKKRKNKIQYASPPKRP